ncbi:MAG: hypothetical protein DSY77_15290, partial [Bacteroidetes bacterium]
MQALCNTGDDLVNAKVGDYVWVDSNKNGLQDSNEHGLGGVKLDLYTVDNEYMATTYSNSSGY